MPLDNKVLLDQVEFLAKILNQWNEQILIGGGVALVLYDSILSQANAGVVGTTDIDFLIPRKPLKPGKEQISKILKDHGYALKMKSVGQPAVESYIRYVDDHEIEVEFLTDSRSRDKEDVVLIKEAGVTAQALSYIEMSLQEVTPLTLPSGNQITVVKPEAWVFHKGLTFIKRTSAVKKYKDLYGIWFVLSHLNETSLAIEKALPLLIDKHTSSWGKTFRSNLMTWIDDATPKDWAALESQDIKGRLTKAGFVKLVKSITKV